MEEMNKEDIEGLCERYGFTHDILGKYVMIRSKRDTWYVLNREHEDRMIILEHQNQHGDSRCHAQGKHKNLENIFKAIDKHDHREFNRNNKFTRITNDFKRLGFSY